MEITIVFQTYELVHLVVVHRLTIEDDVKIRCLNGGFSGMKTPHTVQCKLWLAVRRSKRLESIRPVIIRVDLDLQ